MAPHEAGKKLTSRPRQCGLCWVLAILLPTSPRGPQGPATPACVFSSRPRVCCWCVPVLSAQSACVAWRVEILSLLRPTVVAGSVGVVPKPPSSSSGASRRRCSTTLAGAPGTARSRRRRAAGRSRRPASPSRPGPGCSGDWESRPLPGRCSARGTAARLQRSRRTYGTFRLNFHRFDRFELDLRGHT